ncbi:ABC-2 type transport system permease protein [Filimonas lacunae]|uniref:ABC-2 type transport system permease protein n=1 Tax=Filimonas lacunae TaxID=477680 RepID=A0A173MSC9_9BACT|nr:ABC transporter permease [Filimonas lacunae]BAV10379.1 membrane protein [Filimonas lacunae]SIT16453.1 ABC-2 type transport system permease protein [Filimonas lacunae]
MSKTSLIIQREYLSRVKNKTFLLTTLLTPLLFVFLIGFSAYLAVKGTDTLSIAVQDANGFFKTNLKSSNSIQYHFTEGIDTSNYLAKGYSAILMIPKFEGTTNTDYIIRYQKGIGIKAKADIEDDINSAIEDHMLEVAGVNRSALDSIHKESRFANLKSYQEKGEGASESDSSVAHGIGYVCGFLIYITMFIYGVMVMRGVTEEKTNRIAEVIISSVKPFQLMLGKIVGIGAVGLTQFLIWIVLILGITMGANHFLSPDTLHQVQAAQQGGTMAAGAQSSEFAQGFSEMKHMVGTVNWIVVIGLFLFYFIGGYLFYAALFAAAGSAVEDVQNSQSLTMPITMPIIFSFIILTRAINYPDSPIAVWASIIPFSSPIVMMARVAYGVPGTVPYWQLLASMASLIAGFLFTTWLAGKIYRTGILLYGKKTTWKEMIKWAFVKN